MRIKILFFIENLSGGGAEKVLCNLVNEMNQDLFDITVQTLWKADPQQHLKTGIRYRYCYAEHNSSSVLKSRIAAETGLLYPLHIKDDYDLEVAYLEFGSTKILSRSTNRHAKKIAWVHSDMVRKLGSAPTAVQKISKQYRPYDKIICVSETARDSFIQLFGRENDVHVLYNTIDDAEIRKKATRIPPELPLARRRTVCAVGRLSPEKRFDMLLRIHRRLLDQGLEHDLWIIGDGSQRANLEQLISELRLADSVMLFGYLPNPYPWMKRADFLVCSSAYEGFSTFVAEGLILGKPIVATDCSGMRELLGNSEYGLISGQSEDSLLCELRKMLCSQDLRRDYSKRALARSADFSAKELTARTQQFILDLVRE